MTRSLLFSAMFLLAACAQEGSPQIELDRAWARPTVGQAPGAVYVAIDNKGDRPIA